MDQMQDERPSGPAEWIVAIALDGCRESFARLFRAFAPKVKTHLLRFGLRDEHSEELTQDVFLAIWRSASQFDPLRGSAEAWIYTITRNRRIDFLRREKHPEELRSSPAEEPDTPERMFQSAQGDARVRAALATLPAKEAEVLRLAFYEERSHSRIAEELHLPLGTVKARARRAAARLRTQLGDLA